MLRVYMYTRKAQVITAITYVKKQYDTILYHSSVFRSVSINVFTDVCTIFLHMKSLFLHKKYAYYMSRTRVLYVVFQNPGSLLFLNIHFEILKKLILTFPNISDDWERLTVGNGGWQADSTVGRRYGRRWYGTVGGGTVGDCGVGEVTEK